MTFTPPTPKDMAEFYRFALLAGICDVPAVVQWAESVVAAKLLPSSAFIELCVSGSQSPGTVESLLGDIPGKPTPDLAASMLLGHASRMIADGAIQAETLLLRLHQIMTLETFPDRINAQITTLEDAYVLARDGIHGTIPEALHHFVEFLDAFGLFAPSLSKADA